MRLDDEQESTNVENRRGGGGFRLPGGAGGLPVTGGHLGFGGIVLLVIFALLFRINPLELLNGGSVVAPDQTQQQAAGPAHPEDSFVAKVLHSTETVWTKQFASGALAAYDPKATAYVDPKLVLFDGSISTGCGGATAAVGPFYCPADSKVYLDTSFFEQLKQRFAAPGDFAQAYVIAHEIGHHVQNLVGISAQADQARASMGGKQFNAFSVKLELQADCFAGVWGHDEQEMGKLERGDIEQALNAATAIGDDKLQKQSQGYAVPDSFTHGTSEQRVRWFKRGFDSGDVKQCDTFRAPSL
jgi:predicted metalloprotease